MSLESLITSLERTGWDVQRKGHALQLPPDVVSRYALLPPVWLRFVQQIERCVSPRQTAWFSTEADFSGASGSAYRWNEFERMSLEAAEGDRQIEAEIREFWTRHLPILTSVKSGYGYIAIRVNEPGAPVIYGVEPEFEDASALANSLAEFFDIFEGHVLRGERVTALELMI
jgi:hypothetical protein